jgi:hypothetical protein
MQVSISGCSVAAVREARFTKGHCWKVIIHGGLDVRLVEQTQDMELPRANMAYPTPEKVPPGQAGHSCGDCAFPGDYIALLKQVQEYDNMGGS